MATPDDKAFLSARRGSVIAAAVCVTMLAILPVLAAHHLPLLDAPGHEARLAVLKRLVLDGQNSAFYTAGNFFLPNIAFDVIGLGLARVFDPEMAGRIFFALTLILTLWGILVLNRAAIGRWSFAPLLAGLLLYNLISILGFFSFVFGLALVPWALAARLKLSDSHIAIGLVLGGACGVILVLCHAFAFIVYAAMSTGFALAFALRGRIRLAGLLLWGCEFIPPLAVFLLWSAGESGQVQYGSPYVLDKLSGVAEALTSGGMIADIAMLAGTAAFTVLAIRWARVRLHPAFVPGLAILFALYLLLPFQFGVGANIDKRVPIALIFMAFAGLDLQVRRSTGARVAAAVAVCALVVKQSALALLWHSFDPTIDAVVARLKALPSGAVVMQAECHPTANAQATMYGKWQPALTHSAALAGFDDRLFVASTFANPGQQPIAVKPAYQGFYRLQGAFGSFTCSADDYRTQLARMRALVPPAHWPSLYFLLIRPPAANLLAANAVLVAAGPEFELYNAVKP